MYHGSRLESTNRRVLSLRRVLSPGDADWPIQTAHGLLPLSKIEYFIKLCFGAKFWEGLSAT